MKLKEKTTATLLIAIFIGSMFAVGVQAMHYLGMQGGSLSVISVSGSYPEETVLGDVVFDAQSGQVTIEGSISDLYVASGGWPDTAYLEIGVRPEATKDETNAGIYMIVLASQAEGILCIHLQDYGGQRPPCPPYPAYIPVAKAEKIDYKITLIPSGAFGGTAYLELWDMEGTYQEAPSQEYGYSSAIRDEDFSEARLFYSLMAAGEGEPGITYSATVGDITTDVLLPHDPIFDLKPKRKGWVHWVWCQYEWHSEGWSEYVTWTVYAYDCTGNPPKAQDAPYGTLLAYTAEPSWGNWEDNYAGDFEVIGKTLQFEEVYVSGVDANPQINHIVLHLTGITEGYEIYTGTDTTYWTHPDRPSYEFMDVNIYEIHVDESGTVVDYYFEEHEFYQYVGE